MAFQTSDSGVVNLLWQNWRGGSIGLEQVSTKYQIMGPIPIKLPNASRPKNHAEVEFFDIFIFNNVKSNLNVILYQLNKVVFKVKVLSL